MREPKKVAVFLAVSLSGCDYAALGRHIGLHKDTIASHCAWARDPGDVIERRISVLGSAALVRLEVAGLQMPEARATAPRVEAQFRLYELQRFMDELFEEAFKSLSDEDVGFIRRSRLSSDVREKYFSDLGTSGDAP